MTHAQRPPKWADWLLERICPDELFEGIHGDFIEQYAQLASGNRRTANQRYVLNIMGLIRPGFLLRNQIRLSKFSLSMLRSHLRVGVRSMARHKFYSAVNILGLALSIAFIFLVFLFVTSEMRYDQFHSLNDDIYRVGVTEYDVLTGSEYAKSAISAVPLGPDLQDALPQVEQFTRLGSSPGTAILGDGAYAESLAFVDKGFFEMFDFPITAGAPEKPLERPNSVVLSTTTAEKFFGQFSPIGQTLKLNVNDSTFEVVVASVIDAKESESSIALGVMLPFSQFDIVAPTSMTESYGFAFIETYILMPGESDVQEKEALLTQAMQTITPPEDLRWELFLQPLSRLHFQSEFPGNARFTSARKLYILSGLALLVLVVAIINYVTLSVGNSVTRLQEVGVRKVLGALGGQLRTQFMIEALITSVAATIIGVLISRLAVPMYNKLLGSETFFTFGWRELAFAALLALALGMLSGFIQALILLKRNIALTLKGRLTDRDVGNQGWTHGLIVFQFALSVVLVIGTIGVRSQLNFIDNKDLGYDKEQLVEINMHSSNNREAAEMLFERFRSRAMRNSSVLRVSATMNNCREPWTEVFFEQHDQSELPLYYNQVEPGYLELMNIKMVAGSDFDPNSENQNALLVNEALVEKLGFADPIGMQIPGSRFEGSHRIIGVFRNFHYTSLHNPVEPLVLVTHAPDLLTGATGLSTYMWPPNLYQIMVRIGPGDPSSTLRHLQSVWAEVEPNAEFVYHFVDAEIDAKYSEEQRWRRVTDIASLFAIIIAWLGLLGLVRLSMERRVKEISVRKVLGAEAGSIVYLLTRKYLILVIIGNLIAWPVSWYLLSQWLQSFDYRISLRPVMFVGAGMLVFLFVLSSVGIQSLRAAWSNPVEAINENG